MKINKMTVENMASSLLFNADIGRPAGKNLEWGGDLLEWDKWFPISDQHNDGISKKPNTENLTVWRDGRGAFTDFWFYGEDGKEGFFVDFKGYSKMPKLEDKKIEIFAGSPTGEKRSDGMEHTAKECVDLFLENLNTFQVVDSLKNQDRPYLVSMLWAEIESGKIAIKQIQINFSKIWKHAPISAGSKMGRTGFIVRAKKQTVDGIYENISVRFEVKLPKQNALAYLVSIGASNGVVDLDASWDDLL